MSASIDKNKKVDVDLFTLDIVRDSLLTIGEEMFVALARTSMSPIIYECSITRADLPMRRGIS